MKIHRMADDDFKACQGFSVLDLLIVVVLISIVISFILTSTVRFQKDFGRANAARQFVSYLQQARSDSMRRHATGSGLMAQVTILNDRYYCVTSDANGDGALDMPIVVSVVEQHVTFNGPFPRTFMFSAVGKAVDTNEKAIPRSAISLINSSGASIISVSDAGEASIVQP